MAHIKLTDIIEGSNKARHGTSYSIDKGESETIRGLAGWAENTGSEVKNKKYTITLRNGRKQEFSDEEKFKKALVKLGMSKGEARAHLDDIDRWFYVSFPSR